MYTQMTRRTNNTVKRGKSDMSKKRLLKNTTVGETLGEKHATPKPLNNGGIAPGNEVVTQRVLIVDGHLPIMIPALALNQLGLALRLRVLTSTPAQHAAFDALITNPVYEYTLMALEEWIVTNIPVPVVAINLF